MVVNTTVKAGREMHSVQEREFPCQQQKQSRSWWNMWIYPLLWDQHIQIQIGGKNGEWGNKINKQGGQGDRTGRIFNPPNKDQMNIKQFIFQKGEYKSVPAIELLVWPHYHASLSKPPETQHSWRHRDQEETENPERGLPVCAVVAWRVIHLQRQPSTSGCWGFPDPCAKLADVAQACRRPTHICSSSWKPGSAKARITSSEANKPHPEVFPW